MRALSSIAHAVVQAKACCYVVCSAMLTRSVGPFLESWKRGENFVGRDWNFIHHQPPPPPVLPHHSMTSMQAYLAAKYMTGPKADAILARTTAATSKKKKRKTKPGSEGAEASFIKDDEDELRWGKPMETDEPEEVVVASDRSFKKKQVEKDPEGAGWITVREGEKQDDDVPVEDIAPAPVGGLVMASELRANLPKPKSRKGKEKEREDGKEAETVYRDATGRRIEVESKEDMKARLEREALEERRREAEKQEWGKGLVQREQAESLRREMEKGKTKGVAR